MNKIKLVTCQRSDASSGINPVKKFHRLLHTDASREIILFVTRMSMTDMWQDRACNSNYSVCTNCMNRRITDTWIRIIFVAILQEARSIAP
jgi:hypothetical protein